MLRMVCFAFEDKTKYYTSKDFINCIEPYTKEYVDIVDVLFIDRNKETKDEINDHIVELTNEMKECDSVFLNVPSYKKMYYFIDHFIKIGKRVFVWHINSIEEVNT